jgi:phosphate transport system protein
MAHHFIDRLDDLKDRIARLTALVQQAAELAVEAVLSANAALAKQVMVLDNRIDEEEVQIEKLAIDLLALYQPAASDLRLITIIIKANSDFERIADCAVNAAQRVPPLTAADAPYQAPPDLRLMANGVLATLRDTIKAFNLTDETLARQVLRGDDVVDALYHQIVQDMLARLENASSDANTELSNVMIAKNLERMADHCTNIAEDVIYAHTGRIIRHLHAV